MNSLSKQKSVNETRQHILTSLGTSLDVKTLVHYGTLSINKNIIFNSDNNNKI